MSNDLLALLLARIAVAVGEPVAAAYARGCATAWKPDASPVTEADLAAERLILERLALMLPGIPVVSEECVAAGRIPVVGPRFILVDPLDGTREFVAGRTEFTVNLAMIDGGRAVAGAVYAPLLKRLWFGGLSSYTLDIRPGADFAGLASCQRITVRTPFRGGLVALVSRSHHDAATEAYLGRLPIAERRRAGSSLKFCWIAEGAADLYARFGQTREWDVAAGHAVLSAAGGGVTAPDGGPLRYGDPGRGFRLSGFVAVGRFRLGDRIMKSGAATRPTSESHPGSAPDRSARRGAAK